MFQQLEEKCKTIKSLESKWLTELQNQFHKKQLETERFWSELTNTWAAEKISKDSKIDELKAALEMAREQQAATEDALKTTVEEKTEKIAQVNKLIERVKGMEVKQQAIKQDMEQKLKTVREQTQENTKRMSDRCKKNIRRNWNRKFSGIFRITLTDREQMPYPLNEGSKIR